MKGISNTALTLLKTVQAKGSIQTDQMVLPTSQLSSEAKPGDAARELERKLLIHADQIHTASGAHAKVLETWQHWCKRTGFSGSPVQSDDARVNMEGRLRKLNDEYQGTARLPWQVS
jgi:hypothetical protein